MMAITERRKDNSMAIDITLYHPVAELNAHKFELEIDTGEGLRCSYHVSWQAAFNAARKWCSDRSITDATIFDMRPVGMGGSRRIDLWGEEVSGGGNVRYQSMRSLQRRTGDRAR